MSSPTSACSSAAALAGTSASPAWAQLLSLLGSSAGGLGDFSSLCAASAASFAASEGLLKQAAAGGALLPMHPPVLVVFSAVGGAAAASALSRLCSAPSPAPPFPALHWPRLHASQPACCAAQRAAGSHPPD
jgi:hypothetical protein